MSPHAPQPTATPNTLSQEAIDDFNDNGYLVVPNLISQDLLVDLQAGYDDAVSGRLQVEQWSERQRLGQLMQLQAPSTHIPQLQSRAHLLPILAIAQQLMGPKIDFWYDQLIYKPAGNPWETPWHQDAGYWHRRFGPELPAITCWLAVRDVDTDMGCMQFVPGSHRHGVIEHHSVSDTNPINDALAVENVTGKPVSIAMQAGDVSFHHSMTLHYTSGNNGKNDRCGLVNHLADMEFIQSFQKNNATK